MAPVIHLSLSISVFEGLSLRVSVYLGFCLPEGFLLFSLPHKVQSYWAPVIRLSLFPWRVSPFISHMFGSMFILSTHFQFHEIVERLMWVHHLMFFRIVSCVFLSLSIFYWNHYLLFSLQALGFIFETCKTQTPWSGHMVCSTPAVYK